MTRDPVPEIDFVASSGRRRRRARVAVLSLEGAARAELVEALALASRFDREPLLVAVDGGLVACRAMRKAPDLFVGDGDSAPALPRDIPSIIYPVAKDFSDFSGALDEAGRKGAELIVVAGLLGGRLDHEWANVLTAAASARGFAGILAPSGRGLIAVTAFGLRARWAAGRLVSVFAPGRAARVSLRGTKWPLAKRRLAPGSLGLSNVTGRTLAMDVHEGVVMLVFPRTRP